MPGGKPISAEPQNEASQKAVAAKAASDVVKSVSDVATPILATSARAVGGRRIHRADRIVIAEDPQRRTTFPNPDSEAGHGETVSV
jgi:hypothetical protein